MRPRPWRRSTWPTGLRGATPARSPRRRADGHQASTSTVEAARAAVGCCCRGSLIASPGRRCAGRRSTTRRPNAIGSGRPTSASSKQRAVGSGASAPSSTTRTKYCLAARITPTGRGVDALACLDAAGARRGRTRSRPGRLEGQPWRTRTGRREHRRGHRRRSRLRSPSSPTTARAFAARPTNLRSPAMSRCCATSGPASGARSARRDRRPSDEYEHLYRAPIDDGGALAMEAARFRDIYNRIRPHQALDDRTPRQAYLDT